MSFDSLPTAPSADPNLPGTLELGAFSMSLNVKDLAVSRDFYQNLGFVVTGGSEDHNYLILKNGETTLGLFHGMFDHNILTFNPGLTNRMERLEDYTDIRTVHESTATKGLSPSPLETPDDQNNPANDDSDTAASSGPASFTITDPDGNTILIDQFF